MRPTKQPRKRKSLAFFMIGLAGLAIMEHVKENDVHHIDALLMLSDCLYKLVASAASGRR